VLLQGDPGAGKSVALRHLARMLAAKASRSRRVNCPIPIYVNLKGLRRGDRPIDAGLIQDHVLSTLRDGATSDVDHFLDDEFARGVREGTWIFLFDSFDEIPDILTATDGDAIVGEYSIAIHSFLTGMRKCRGVVASRRFRAPRQVGWPSWTLVPLSEKRRRLLIKRARLGRAKQALLWRELPATDETLGSLPANPMFLGLLCEYIRTRDRLPPTTHDVFEQYMRQRLGRDAERLRERYGVEVSALRDGAQWIAYCMVTASGLGLTPARAEVEEQLAQQQIPLQTDANTVMNALEYLKLARGDGQRAGAGSATFTFAHRRFQEYFATCVVLAEPDRVSARSLLLDGRWRETAVTLLQTQETATPALLTAAGEVLAGAANAVPDVDLDAWESSPVERGAAFAWPPGALHVLGLLQSGLLATNPVGPDVVQQAAARILTSAFRHGYRHDRKWAIEVCGVADADTRARLVRQAFRVESDWLRDATAWQVARLSHVSSGTLLEIRRMLLRLMGAYRLRAERLTVKAQLSRVRTAPELLRTFRALRAIAVVDQAVHVGLIACLLYGATRLAPSQGNQMMIGLAVIAVMVSMLVTASFAMTLGRRTGPSSLAKLQGSADTHDATSTTVQEAMGSTTVIFLPMIRLALLTFAASGCADAIGATSSQGRAQVQVALVYLLSWSFCALVLAEAGSDRSPLGWVVPQLTLLHAVLARARRTPIARMIHSLRWPVLSVAGSAAVFGVLAWLGAKALVVVAVVIVPLGLFATFLLTRYRLLPMLHDMRWYVRWRARRVPGMTPGELLDRLGEQQTSRGACRLLADVRREQLLERSERTNAVLLDLTVVAGATIDRYRVSGDALKTDEVIRWTRAGGRALVWTMVRFGSAFLDELSRLLEAYAPPQR